MKGKCKKKKKLPYAYNKIFPIMLLIATLFMGIGYASINSISLGIDGEMTAALADGIYITEINSCSDDCEIINSYGTYINSNIVLSASDSSSNVTYEVVVYNSLDEDYIFVGTFYDEEFYSNDNIVFELIGLEKEDVIASKGYLTFQVVFKYADGVVSDDSINELDSFIEYRFESYDVKASLSGIEFNYLVKNGEYAPEGDVYDYYSVDANRLRDESIKIIEFGKTSDYESEIEGLEKEAIDVYRTGSISLYRKELEDGMYKIYILSDTGNFILNSNSAWMFDKLYNLEEIVNLHLLNTSNVVNMRDMFCDCAKLENIDLSNFDTSNVTNMIGMFARMTEIEYLDLTSFDTSKVTEMGQMFTADTALEKIYVSDKWDVSENVTAGTGVFSNCTSLVGGNGTSYNSSNVSYTMAVVDGNQSGYLTGDYKLDTGIQFNHVVKGKTAEEITNWTSSSRFEDTDIVSITFGERKDYYDKVKDYTGVNVDSDDSGVIQVYRIPNGSNYDIYVLANSGNFVVNEDASWMFDKLLMLEEINNLNLLDTSKVTVMRDMFCDCQTISTLDLSNFSTINVVSMEGMFARVYHVKTFDLSSFNTINTTNIKNMFALGISASETYTDYQSIVPALTSVYVSSLWSNDNMSDDVVFTNCVNLIGGNGTVFSSSNNSATYARVDSENSPGYFTWK